MGCFRPMPLHDSLLAKRKFERLLCRTPFLFHFQLPSTIFYKYVKIEKTQRFLQGNCFFVYHSKYIHILCSGKMVAKNGWRDIPTWKQNDAVWFPVKYYVRVTHICSNCDKTTSQSQIKTEKSVIFITNLQSPQWL